MCACLFRNDPPWAACAYAVEELTCLVQTPNLSLRPILVSTSGEVNIAEISKRRNADTVLGLRVEVDSLLHLTKIANFDIEVLYCDFLIHILNVFQFSKIFYYQELVSQKDNVCHLMSNASLTLFPEYESKILVLQAKDYINSSNTGMDIKKNVDSFINFFLYSSIERKSSLRNGLS